jgi:hypothetical protein
MKTLILAAALCFSFAAPAHVAAPAGAQAATPAAPPAAPLIVAGLAAAFWVARRRLKQL